MTLPDDFPYGLPKQGRVNDRGNLQRKASNVKGSRAYGHAIKTATEMQEHIRVECSVLTL